MRIVVFGLSMSSSWGNGHATLWRSLAVALERAGHQLVFFERDQPYYAEHRDAPAPRGCELVLYERWGDVASHAAAELRWADAAIVTSYCPDALAASRLVLGCHALARAFYDLDSPVTLAKLERGEDVPYLPPEGLADFDVVLSYAGGRTLRELERRLGARRVVPLHGSADGAHYRRVDADPDLACDLSYLGTYGEDRRGPPEKLFLAPAAPAPERQFPPAGVPHPPHFP